MQLCPPSPATFRKLSFYSGDVGGDNEERDEEEGFAAGFAAAAAAYDYEGIEEAGYAAGFAAVAAAVAAAYEEHEVEDEDDEEDEDEEEEEEKEDAGGLSRSEFAMLPEQTGNGSGPVNQCCICMEDMTSTETIVRLPDCLHTFHRCAFAGGF